MKTSIVVLILIICFFPSLFASENIKFENYFLEEGLSQSTVLTVYQDSLGFMWFGTQDGLNKYDGYEFKVFKHDPFDSTTIADNFIWGLGQDELGNLWVANNSGPDKMDISTELVTNLGHNPNNPKTLRDPDINNWNVDTTGILWFATAGGGISRFNPEINGFIHYRYDSNDSTTISSDNVQFIFNDDHGTLWVRADNGLNRYNRETDDFTRFIHEPDNPFTLSDSVVTNIYFDSTDVFWVGTLNGLNKLDRETGKIKRYLHDPENPNTLSDTLVTSIIKDTTGTIWVGTENGGLNKFDAETETFTRINLDIFDTGSDIYTHIAHIFPDRNSNLWIVIGSRSFGHREYRGILKYDISDNKFIDFTYNSKNPNCITDSALTHFIEDEYADGLWLCTSDDGVFRYDEATEELTHYQHDPDDPYSISGNPRLGEGFRNWRWLQQSNGNVWLSTDAGGVDVFDRETERFHHYTANPLNPYSLGAPVIHQILEDNRGNIWIGTYGGGVNKYSPEKQKFDHFEHKPYDENSLRDNSIWSFYVDDEDILWVGTYETGLTRMDRTLGEYSFYDIDERNDFRDNIIAIHEDKDEILWLGIFPGGIACFDKERGEVIKRYQPDFEDTTSFLSHSPTAFAEDSQGTLWITGRDDGIGGGLFKYNSEDDNFQRFHHDLDDSLSLSSNLAISIYIDIFDTIWVGTHRGVNKFNRKTETFARYDHDQADRNSLSHNTVFAVTGDTLGNLWMGTPAGLNKFDRETESFTRYTERDGLANNHVYGVVLDKNGHIWASTNNGISRLDPTTEEFKNYDVNDGLQSNEFNQHAYYISQDGEIFFGGINGFNAFYPDSLKDNPNIPDIVITSLKIDDQEIAKNISENFENKEIHLSYKQDLISFDFVALDYIDPSQHQYAYMLEGFDKDWRYTDANRRFASYTNLDAGNYVFRVKGSNCDGIWNEAGVSVNIAVSPAPWETWWAYIIYILIIGGSVFGYIRYKNIQHEKELEQERMVSEKLQQANEALKRADKMKDEFLANTSHELRTPLNGIIGIAESLIDGATEKLNEETQKNLSMIISSGRRLTHLVNEILDFSKLKSKEITLQKKIVDMKQITEIILTLSQPLLAGKDIELKDEISQEILPVEGDENRLQQILHNLIGNAIKFTESGYVAVYNSEIDGMTEIIVEDTGIGIPEDKYDTIFQSFEQVDSSSKRMYGGTGLGLAVTKKLVELHGGNIWLESEVGKGTKFHFTLPKGEAEKMESIAFYHPETEEESIISGIQDEEASLEIESEEIYGVPEKFTILVVDDDPVNVKVLENHLSLQNYEVIQAFNGFQALDAMETHDIDLVLLDIMMPKMSGYDVCQKIRETYPITQLPVIILTAKNQATDLVTSLQLGANDYLTKPFSKTELFARLKTHLNLAKINYSYSRFVPHEFLNFLGKDSILELRYGDQIQKEMTVMFADIRSYTTLSESMTPKENFNFLNAYLGRVGPIIKEKHGFVNQYYGDGIMSLFTRSPRDSLVAAIDMQKKVAEYNEERKKKDRVPIRIGIGIHTGKLMLGIIGDRVRMEGGVVSDTVNSASRIEGLTKYYGASILTSEVTFSQIEDLANFNFRFLGKVQVKGKHETLAMFEFFDGDSQQMKALKAQTKIDFEDGLYQYFDKDFESASQLFAKVLAMNPNDKAAQLYLERSNQYQKEGIPGDWDGVELIDRK